jgi:FkbM family methyltransferase
MRWVHGSRLGRRAKARIRRFADARTRHRRSLSHYREFMGPGDLVFDLGANIGARTMLFRELGASVVAVDPQPSSVTVLNARFGDDDAVTVVGKAVAAAPGTYELKIGEYDTLSTLSPDWIESVRASGRFPDVDWPETVEVPGTTLDALIDEFGVPQFCKIDVEGYEPEVVGGLTQTLPAASFEFAAEVIDRAVTCIEAFSGLGPCRFALSYEESMTLNRWEAAEQVISRIKSFPDELIWGDVYVRSTQPS